MFAVSLILSHPPHSPAAQAAIVKNATKDPAEEEGDAVSRPRGDVSTHTTR